MYEQSTNLNGMLDGSADLYGDRNISNEYGYSRMHEYIYLLFPSFNSCNNRFFPR